MASSLSRRRFVQLGGLVAAAPAAAPVVRSRGGTRPIVIASANGHRFRHGGPRTCVEEAFLHLSRGGDVLDALLAGVRILELDPEETGVGYGGLPNADGVVQLDAAVMHGRLRRAGAVACLEGVRTPSAVARAVMDHTDHQLLVGRDAQAFARRMGFPIEEDLNTPTSRRLWLEWRRRIDPEHWLDPARRGEAGERAARQMLAEGLLDPHSFFGTVFCGGLSARGEVAAATSTSGLAWKIPGRVGDSPVVGAGLYVDGAVGCAGSTGRGEANLYHLSSFLIVECLRQGMHPKDAGLVALRRIREGVTEKRLLNARGNPRFNVTFYILNTRGQVAGVSLYAGPHAAFAVCTEQGAQTLPCEGLLGPDEGPEVPA
ncbi:MAG: N(4)-(beta-N-acetylglucosaminyl)-L-asparaginase [Myxococcales bacterium]|nr:N(4)-(beta-N-acetylglucosaminyl)-L-asparaginase [Myxococcota bacterium]MDW8283654.1 N(4)-(beta-N-acetylglucosaminyl)-L-asparaginase [Myxococcales bacterium]